jgi:peptidoglycan/LPS O-acetylase OafA/YrhL
MIMVRSKDYFRGLDGLRFIGTVIVLLFHIERRKSALDIPSIGKYYVKSGLGQCAMTSFFVLSGFLIIYILLNERNKTGTIDIKRFYKRRAARIWPLYYILIFLVFLLGNNESFKTSASWVQTNDYPLLVAFYLLHLPNFHVFFTSSVLALTHLWSLGVEEQFYAICPWMIKRSKKILKVLVFIVVFKVILKILVTSSYRMFDLTDDMVLFLKQLDHFLFTLRFEAFAIGGISAYFLIEKKETVLNFIYRPDIQRLNSFILLLTVPLGYFSESLHLLFSVNFGIIILNMAGNNKPFFMLDNKYTNYIGQISYGIYMYQIPVIILISNAFAPNYSSDYSVIWNITYHVACVAVTVLISVFSYEFIERKFIDGKALSFIFKKS